MSETTTEPTESAGCFQIGCGVALVLPGFFVGLIGLSFTSSQTAWAASEGGAAAALIGLVLLVAGVFVLVNAAKASKAAPTQPEQPKPYYPNDGIEEHDNRPEGQ